MAPFFPSLLLLLLGSLVMAATPPGTASCNDRLFALRVSAGRNATGHDAVKAKLVQSEGARWTLDVDAGEQRAREGGARTRVTSIALFAAPEGTTSEGDCKELRKLQQAQDTTNAELRGSNAELKASLARLQEQLEAVSGALQETNARLEAAEQRRQEAVTAAAPTAATVSPLSTLTEQERKALSEKLVEAAKEERVEEMRKLIADGADVRYKEQDGETALFWAARKGRVDALRLLLARGAIVDAVNKYGFGPLHLAAYYGKVQFVEELKAAGADLDARDHKGQTPLHFAVSGNQQGTVRTLLALGADASIWNNDGKTPRDFTSSEAVRALLTQ